MKTRALAAVLAAAVLVPAAHADGLPVISVDAGPSGVAQRQVRYVALADGQDTFVERVAIGSARVLGSRVLHGRLTIPVVAYDGSPSGLSANGKTLVLISPRASFPRAATSFAVVNPKRLTLRKRITLRGDYSFDAISPDGRWMYLIRYTSARDPLRYDVRAFDVVHGKLDPKPIVDPRQPDEAMNGRPLTRTTSSDSRWAYTLYEGAEHPFVHALDTVGRQARCIDLDWLTGRDDLSMLRFALRSRGLDLEIQKRGEPVAVLDTRTFAASLPTERERHWLWLIAPVAALLGGAMLVYRAGSQRRAASTSLGGATSA